VNYDLSHEVNRLKLQCPNYCRESQQSGRGQFYRKCRELRISEAATRWQELTQKQYKTLQTEVSMSARHSSWWNGKCSRV